MKNKNDKCDIVLRVSVVSSALIGYGNVYACTVADIKKGVFPDKQIRVVILSQDKNLDTIFGTAKQDLLEIGFVKKNANEPYSLMPINGFVDSEKTSWEIIYAKNSIQ